MSFEEVASLIKESTKQTYERERLQCFFNLVAQGTKIKEPKEIIAFEWEKGDKPQPKTRSKNEIKNIAKKLENKINT